MKTYAFTTLIASIFLLSGCTGEPSEQDIYTAMNKVMEQTNAIVKSIAGKDVPKDALRELKSVKKHDCEKLSDKSYKCNVTALVDNEKRTAAVTLIKTDDGWQVIDK
ncbi:cell wall-binding protein [Escherichia coli]